MCVVANLSKLAVWSPAGVSCTPPAFTLNLKIGWDILWVPVIPVIDMISASFSTLLVLIIICQPLQLGSGHLLGCHPPSLHPESQDGMGYTEGTGDTSMIDMISASFWINICKYKTWSPAEVSRTQP